MTEYIERERAMQIAFTSPFFSNALMEEIKVIPAADVAPVVHGRWIRFKEHDSCYVHMRCSECSAYWSDPSHADSFRYCPNCGAKMDKN